MIGKPSLLLLMAATAGIATVANAVTAAGPQDAPPKAEQPKSRLGNAIGKDIADRDAAAARRTRSLDLREQAAAAAEARLKASMAAPAPAGGATGAAPDAPPSAEEIAGKRYDELARIYQAMKPKRAAAVFEQLTMEVQVEVARRIRDRSMAAILANMTPEGAAKLTMALARGDRAPPRPTGRPTRSE